MADHFYGMPTRRDLGNSVFRPHPARVLTTFNAGKLVPLWSREMLPGESLEVDPSFVLRSQTPLRPVFDDAFFDIYAFYVPNRLVLDSWEQVMGANKTSYWVDDTEHVVPYVNLDVQSGSVADYFGLPLTRVKVNALRFRMYALIFNEWFRDQNTMSPAACPTNANNVEVYEGSSDPFLDAYKGGSLLPVCRLPDYFSVCTPGPLKATNVVSLNLPDAPVISAVGRNSEGGYYQLAGSVPTELPLLPNGSLQNKPATNVSIDPAESTYVIGTDPYEAYANGYDLLNASLSVETGLQTALFAQTSLSGISINDFRFAVQLQKLLERDLFGTRYTEILQSHFNVKTQDARLQRPELFGWSRFRLNQQQVAQTSGTAFNDSGDPVSTPLGDLAAYSLTVSAGQKWRIASPEHGYVIILGTVRVKHSYQQGLERSWSRFGRYDFAWPEFVGLGNQPVYTRELYANAPEKQVFGYQEYAADYRYNRKICTGEMRSGLVNSLDSWHYADYYGSIPTLGSTWMADNSDILIDRTLAVSSDLANQFFGAFDFGTSLTTWLPTYSIPGYVDHF